MREKKVVVTACNIISSLGLDIKSNWENLVKGKSGIDRITLFDPSNLLTQIAAEFPKEFDDLAEEKIKKRTASQMMRATKASYIAAVDAIDSLGSLDDIDKTKVAVIMGVVSTGKLDSDPRNMIIKGMNNSMSAWIAMKYKFEGPNYTIATACSSSAYAIANGYDLIKSGVCDLVIAGGADSTVNPDEIRGFNELLALSTNNSDPKKASRPFSLNRDGFVIGEGAAVLILESEDSAKRGGREIFAEVAGYALTTECYNIMAPMENGIGMAKTMELALKNAAVSVDEVDYINAHGTSTVLNDKYETAAIKRVFKDRAYKIAISSTKSMIGHTIGAAGAVEAVVTILSIKNRVVTPTINFERDPELDLDYVADHSRSMDIRVALSNSFAFGGHNATLVFKRYNY